MYELSSDIFLGFLLLNPILLEERLACNHTKHSWEKFYGKKIDEAEASFFYKAAAYWRTVHKYAFW